MRFNIRGRKRIRMKSTYRCLGQSQSLLHLASSSVVSRRQHWKRTSKGSAKRSSATLRPAHRQKASSWCTALDTPLETAAERSESGLVKVGTADVS